MWGQMGTKLSDDTNFSEEIEAIQEEIKEMLGRIKWSHNKFASWYFKDMDDYAENENEDEKKFIEKFKKDLSRGSTSKKKLDLLKKYKEYLYELSEVKRIEGITLIMSNLPISEKKNKKFLAKMESISRMIDKRIKEEQDKKNDQY